MLGKIIEFLSGRKTTIATIIGLFIVFSVDRGYLPTDIATLISGIMVALGFTMNVATTKYYANK